MVSLSPEGTSPFNRLSQAARSAWAKHDRKTDAWLPLWRHMADSGAVAGMLWEHWVPQSVRRAVADVLPGGPADAERLVLFLAAAHDSGKATPAFACQVESLGEVMRRAGLDMHTLKEFGESRRLAPHGLAGQLLLQEWMRERHGLSSRVAGQFAVVAGGHHGMPPDTQQIHDLQLRPHLLRHPGPSEESWRRVQYELMDGCAELAGVRDRLGTWEDVRLPQTVQVLLTAVVILADWIASAPELFPYAPESWQPLGPTGEIRRLRAAWEGLDLPAPWMPNEPVGSAEELFTERFPKFRGTAIRPVQAEAARIAQEMEPGGLLIIEAPMGEGKTEAAFLAAEILAARSGAGGVLFALPTRATVDAMFPRLLSWLDQLPDEGSGPRSVVLAHAKAALNEEWSGLLRAGSRSLAAVDPDSASTGFTDGAQTPRIRPAELHAHQWLRGRKKQLLASFAVGTVDQVLFAGLKSRHLALRHLAVAGKVVVIDEVHAYDAYMNRYLDRVLEWLAAYRVPVVLLSATLPAERRRSLVAAYAGAAAGENTETSSQAYPLITAVAPGRPVLSARPEAASGRRTQVSVEAMADDLDSLTDRLDAELSGGGCALVVRNTVDRVLDTAAVLRERFGEENVTVAHSRFVAADRAAKDAELRGRYGPDVELRPDRHVVVASQVVEQSLDVDFDLLVTDLAPVDLMLQRMGRLHRHPRRRPAGLARARCLVTGVDWQAEPPEPVAGSHAVYPGRWTLLRALAVLEPHLNGRPVELPASISPLVQDAYGPEPIGPAAWAAAMAEAMRKHRALLDEKRRKAEGFLLGPVRRAGRPVYGWLTAHAGDAEDSRAGRAQVRDSDETIEVLVVQRLHDGRLATLPELTRGRGSLELPTDFPPDRRTAETVAASALTLPGRFSTPWRIDRTIAELERELIPAWQVKECPWLAGELLLVLDGNCQTRLSEFDLSYSAAEGLRMTSPGVRGGGSGDGEHRKDDHDARSNGGTEDSLTAWRGDSGGAAMTQAVTDVAGRATTKPVQGETGGPPSFDLVSQPWLPVLHNDGTVEEVSLLKLFATAGDCRRLVGDLPTQEAALLRVLLAILYDALEGPAEIEDWEKLWPAADPFAEVPAYLERHRERFALFHPARPFFQVADLRTGKDELAPLNRIVADVPAGSPFFSMRQPGVERLSYAEAARWLVHTHAYDTSGIKSATVGDPRGRSGKVYPLGVGSMGSLGGIFAEGANLRETLLLNLIAFEDAYGSEDFGDGSRLDLPVWRQEHPLGAGPRGEEAGGPEPAGLRDLYTWQSRRLRLHAEGGCVTGVVLGYGDPHVLSAPWKLEPMSGWRRSPTQEKKQGRSPVYVPARHDPSRAAWRGLAALLPSRGQAGEVGRHGEAAEVLRSGVTQWFTHVLTTTEELDVQGFVRLRLIGAVYGTQQSVIDEIIDDSVVLPVITLHEEQPLYGAAAVDAVSDTESAVSALGQLAANLARAAGSDPLGPASTARDMAFGILDGPYRAWLRNLLEFPDLHTAREAWHTTARHHITRLAEQLLGSASAAAAEGRLVDMPGAGKRLIDAGRAEQWFRARLAKALPLARA
ncbi:type I-E CRISPR-associated protein Cse1/CasA [Streptomyces sp. NBC_00287]|uniref:type I-E CRISPR-associated protein Cse1/CasA n=1 Tax=Streptomyces sp. NBC_00287 TaxID=2975702 RepID=UPI002E2D8112|nr:type I-E CRISPR-associated protein Cse1/CasA [Streptomyces sp. NBC_00287]